VLAGLEPVAPIIRDPIPQPAAEPDAAPGQVPVLNEAAATFSGDAMPPPPGDSEDGSWPSESAEAAAIADGQVRGETIIAAALSTDAEEETEKKELPSLDQLLQKVPAEVRDTMEELFRAKWTRVIRVRKKDLV